ncbi:MAG TPA: carboxypeptidase regulatory-like domain-containing protein, partial [Blastocatellia bacterium]|nr:carboxypeptidase regulatory-like domain-containing protein [Blastocatellia bacterium]
MHRRAKFVIALIIQICLFGPVCFYGFINPISAQTVTGRIAGTVTDASDAALPGVTVKITHTGTDLVRTVATDANGFYVATSLPVGTYTVSIEHQGFKKIAKTGYDLIADGRLTVDFRLETGAVTDAVEVTAQVGETVNSTSGEVARVIDSKQVQELALNGRNYMQLTTLIPGAPLLNDNQLELMTGLSVAQPINGNRGNANNLTVDGGFNLDSGSNGSQINNVGIDFIREVNIKTSNFSAEYGRNSGAAINVVTRSGENQFHGSAFEYLRNEKLDSNTWLNNTRGISRPSLRYNNFGFSLGGPIKRDKLFFFGGMEWKLIRRFAETSRNIPTLAERNGDFRQRLRGADGIIGTTDDGLLRDPASGLPCTAADRRGCFLNNTIPTGRFTPDGQAIRAVYNAAQQRAVSYSDALTGNNIFFRETNPFDFRQEILRLDYRLNEKHTLYGRYLHDDYDLIAPFGTFIDSQLPTIPTNRRRPAYGYQIGHTWLISTTLINEVKFNASWNGQRVPPLGDAWKRDVYGFTYRQIYSGGLYDNSIPNADVTGYASFRGANGSLISPTTDLAVSDNLSWVRGAHTLKTGLLLIRNRKDQNGRSLYAGMLTFNTSNPNTTGNAFADALLGNFRSYSEAESDPVGFFRFSQIEAYLSDNWKVNRKLSLEIGARYQYGWPTYTQANNIVNFDPSLYDPARAVTVVNGVIDPTRGGNRYNGLVRAGDGVPDSELGRVPNGNSTLVQSIPAGAPRGLYQPQHLIGPRFSFAYAPFNDTKTAIRGGFGIFFDKPEGNLIFSSINLPPYVGSVQFENNNLASLGTIGSVLAPFGEIQTIDPKLVVPYTMNYSLSIQRELPGGFFGEISYIGNQGRHLIRQPDINQTDINSLSSVALRPYKGFSAIRMRLSDSTSNYNALQLYAAKRKGRLTMTAGYTFSKVLADTSGNGDNPEAPFDRSFNYGPTEFDRRHIFTSTFTYQMPFFLKSKGLLSKAAGGWEVSGITHWQTGRYFTPLSNTASGNRRADYLGGEISLPEDQRTLTRWFNTAAFGAPPANRRGTAGVGSIVGPGRYSWDLALR